MSRFVALLETYRSRPMTPALFCRMAQDMLPLLNAQEGDMSAAFPYFLSKKAPISGAQSLLDYDLAWTVPEIGRASCRERVCQYVEISVVAGQLTKKTKQ